LAKEQSYEDWVYLVSKWTVDPLLKVRKDLLEAEPATPEPATPEALTPAPVVSDDAAEGEGSLFDPFPTDNP
jgi:hypothetical protein